MTKAISEYIPKNVPKYIERKYYDTGKTDLQILESAFHQHAPTLLIGASGSGKTHIVKYIAQKHGIPLIRMNFSDGTAVEDLLGTYLVEGNNTIWHDGALSLAMRHGAIFLADEINFAEPDILALLNPVLEMDNPALLNPLHDNEIIYPHQNFWFVATMNYGIKYYGTKEMNEALLDRFIYTLYFTYPSPEDELKILVTRYPDADPLVLESLIKLFNSLRKEFAEYDIDISTRTLIKVCHIAQSMPLKVAFELALYSKFKSETTRNAVKLAIKRNYSNLLKIKSINEA